MWYLSGIFQIRLSLSRLRVIDTEEKEKTIVFSLSKRRKDTTGRERKVAARFIGTGANLLRPILCNVPLADVYSMPRKINGPTWNGLMDVVKFSRCTGSDSRGSLGPRDSISRSCIGIGIAVKYARGISFTFFHKFLRDFYPNIREIFINVISNDFFFFFFCDSRNFFQVNSTFIYFCIRYIFVRKYVFDRLKFV